jgi:hypothetical protein
LRDTVLRHREGDDFQRRHHLPRPHHAAVWQGRQGDGFVDPVDPVDRRHIQPQQAGGAGDKIDPPMHLRRASQARPFQQPPQMGGGLALRQVARFQPRDGDGAVARRPQQGAGLGVDQRALAQHPPGGRQIMRQNTPQRLR